MSNTSTANLTLKVDYENNAEEWWDAARTAVEAGDTSQGADVFRRLDRDNRSLDEGVFVLADELAAFNAWAEALPGYDDGPEHARRPYVVIQDDGSDDTDE